MDRGAWWAILHRVAKSQTRLKQLSTHTYNLCKLTFHHPETAFQVSMVQVTHLHQPETDSNLPTGIEKDENTYPTLLQDMEQKRVLMYSFHKIPCDIHKLRNNGHIDFVNSIFRPCFKMICMPIGK